MKIVAVISMALLISSCGMVRLSSDDMASVRSGEKAIVKTYNQPLLAGLVLGEEPVVSILSVDGEKVDNAILSLDQQVTVDVGLRVIEFGCSSRGGYDERDFTEVIKLEIKPYHEYQVRCGFDTAFGENGSYVGDFSINEKSIR